MPSKIVFNDAIQLILTDVDQTLAETYVPAKPAMIQELSLLLEEGRVLFLVTGGSLARVRKHIVDRIPAALRSKILVAHCSGAEVWGFNASGALCNEPFYTLYDSIMNDNQKRRWRELIKQLIAEFHLEAYPSMPKADFIKQHGSNPLLVMFDDRGPQITFGVVNGNDLSPAQEKSLEIAVPQTYGALDLRIPILERADELFRENDIPSTPKLGGVAALDFVLKGVSKTEAVKYLFSNEDMLDFVGLTPEIVQHPAQMEIWGDRFDRLRGGTDRHMQEAVDKTVRAIDFRQEDADSFLPGYNIVLWDGKEQLHDGLLEYLIARHQP